ncbi:MAG: LacI family DNA-binding transcriptional regulator [Sphaerochaetaceae bacterium]|jgi:LacI family transcriptional regulator
MGITTKDIARIAGVSQSTVSRCLNNSPLISKETREKVLKIADDLQFEFNASARSLSTSRTNTIGIIYPDDYIEFGVNLYFGSLHTQIREILEKENIDLIIAFKENRYTKTDTIKRLVSQRKVDGLIIALSDVDKKTIEFLTKSKIPYVFLHFHQISTNLNSVNQIYADHLYGGYVATKHLINLGHENIICISANGGYEFHLRREGYKKALQENNIKVKQEFLLYGDRTFKSGYNLVIDNFELIKSATAIFAHTDIMALGAIEALKERNVNVPHQISIVGYDDIELASYFTPHLTTIHQPREEIALLATNHLLDLIESKSVSKGEEIKIKPTLMIRDSCNRIN